SLPRGMVSCPPSGPEADHFPPGRRSHPIRRPPIMRWLACPLAAAAVVLPARADDRPAGSAPVGVVCGVQVLSDKVPDVSIMEAWKRSYIKDGMSDQVKPLPVWRTVVAPSHQDAPP